MAVRFLPPPDEGSRPEDRGDLAEVIQLRAQLNRRESVASDGRASDDESEVSPEAAESARDEPSRRRATREELAKLVDSGVASLIEAGTRPVVQGDFSRRVPSVPSETGDDRRDAAICEPSFESESDAAGWEPAAPERSAHEDAVRILGRRARSSGELREELARLSHDAGEIEEVIEEFTRSLYLDDLGLARALSEKLRDSKRASRSQIRVKLQARKLPNDVIEAAVGELDPDEEFELLRQTARDRAAKLGGLERHVAERRLLGYLARRGWSGESALRAVRDALDGALRRSGGASGGSGVRFQ